MNSRMIKAELDVDRHCCERLTATSVNCGSACSGLCCGHEICNDQDRAGRDCWHSPCVTLHSHVAQGCAVAMKSRMTKTELDVDRHCC